MPVTIGQRLPVMRAHHNCFNDVNCIYHVNCIIYECGLFFLYEGMLEFPQHWSFALVAVERNFWARLLSGAAQGPDAQVWQSWLHHA